MHKYFFAISGALFLLGSIIYMNKHPLPPSPSTAPSYSTSTGPTTLAKNDPQVTGVGLPGNTQWRTAPVFNFSGPTGDTEHGEYKYVIDARVLWQALPDVTLSTGDIVEFDANGKVCSDNPTIGCVGPNGHDEHPECPSLDYPDPHAPCQSLVGKLEDQHDGRFGDKTFFIGAHLVYKVPDGYDQQVLKVMDNFHKNYLSSAQGGFVLRVRVAR